MVDRQADVAASSRFRVLSVLGPSILAIVLGLAVIGGRSVASDEAFTWGITAQDDLASFWDALRFASGNQGIYFVVVRFFLLFGDGLVWLRLPSLLFFVGTVWMVGHIGRSWFGARAALFAGALAATSVPLLYYGIEMRSYALVGLASTFVWFGLDRALEQDTRTRWLLLGLSCGLAVSAHVLMALVLPLVAVLVLVLGGHGIVGTALRLTPIAVAVLPTVVLLAYGDGSNTDWIPGLSPRSIASAGRLLLGDHAQFTPEGSGFLIAGLFALGYAFAAVAAVRSRAWESRRDVLVWCWFLSMPFALMALSLVEPYLWHRYLLGSLPGGLLVLGKHLAGLERRTVAVGFVVVLSLLGVVRSFALRPHSADSYRELAEAIEERAQEGDALVVAVPWVRAGLDYEWRDEAPVLGRPGFGPDFDYAREVDRLDRGPAADDVGWVADGTRLWVVARADSSQVTVRVDRPDDEWDFGPITSQLDDAWELVDEFDVQRFRVRLYES